MRSEKGDGLKGQKGLPDPVSLWAQNFGPDTYVVCGLAEGDERAGIWAFKLLGQHIVVALVAPSGYFENDHACKRLPTP